MALFSRVGISETEIRERITEPYFATLPEQPTSLPIHVLTEATVLSAWDDAKQVRTSPAAPPLPATQMVPEGPAPVAAYSANHSVLSTTLRPGQLAEQVEKYESSWSPRRSFLVKMLLGAESVLARLLHEANSSRMFTPVGLGEILKNRAYAPNGQLNVLAQKKSEEKALGWRRTGDTAELVEANNQYVPKTQWAIIDGLEAVKWAYTWAAYGPDEVADMFIRPSVFFARQRPDELDGVRSLYEAASWELAILLMGVSTFDIAVSDVSSRTMWMREYLEDYRINNRRYSKGEGKGAKKGQSHHDRTRLSSSRERHQRRAFPRSSPRRSSPRSHRERSRSPPRRGASEKELEKDQRGAQPDHSEKNKKKATCKEYDEGGCVSHCQCPKGLLHRC